MADHNSSTVLVIGSSGFIGSHLTQLLASRGHTVVGFDVKEPEASYGVDRFIQGDVRQRSQVEQAVHGVDIVINLAAVHADFGYTPEEYFDTNETGMETLLDVMSQADVKRMVFSSSIAVYGERTEEANEETPPNPTTPYGASKLAAEQKVREWIASDPARCVTIIRPCVVYGERNVSNMLNLIRQIQSGLFVLFGSGKNVKATAYVGNLIEAICQQLDALSPGLKIYNYADKPDMTVTQIVNVIRTELGKSRDALRLPLWLGMLAAAPFDLVANITGKNLPVSRARVKKLAQATRVDAQKIRSDGFQQKIRPSDGLGRMVRHVLIGQSSNGTPPSTNRTAAVDRQPAEN